jgi:4-cresol dehydrogenase (hydroxylating)
MMIPTGVTREDFAKAIAEFEEVLGKEWTFTSDADVDLYRDAYSPFRGDEREIRAAAALAPENTDQVQKIMRIANAYRVPVYPISTGRNLGYGGSAPVLPGSVVLDLKRMNRIIEVNERNAYALVEPGVSYFDLYRYLRARNLKLWIDVASPGWGSLIGNALDHGAGHTATPYRDHFDAHCGMEVVLADGDIVRTGMGALPGARTWQEYKYGLGPYLDGLFAQSNYGVVTKMGFWLMPEPEAYRAAIVKAKRYQDIIPVLDIMNKLLNCNLLTAKTTLGSPTVTRLQTDPDARNRIYASPDLPAAMDKYGAEHDLDNWTLELKFYGPEEIIAAHWQHARKQFSAIPGAGFDDGLFYRFPMTDAEISEVVFKQALGVPSLSIFSLVSRSPQQTDPVIGHVTTSQIIPMHGEAVLEAREVIGRLFHEYGMAEYYSIIPQSYIPRMLVFLFLFRVTGDADENARTMQLIERLHKLGVERGWAPYRSHAYLMDNTMDLYSYNNHALRRVCETLKDAIDPNGIIAAGRYGIWPRHLRKRL